MGFVSNLHRPVEEWDIGAVPLMSLMQLELRKGRQKPVIAKALVDLKDKPFQFFASQRELWRVEDHYSFPGPMQFTEGPKPPLSLRLEESA